MVLNLIKYIILLFLLFLSYGFQSDNSSKDFFDIFSPKNTESGLVDGQNSNQKVETVNDFTVYGVINSKDIKKVYLKPKLVNPEIKALLNSRGYVVLKLGEKINNYQLIEVNKDTAIFKNNQKVIKLAAFVGEKNDRPAVVAHQEAQIIATPEKAPVAPQPAPVKTVDAAKKIEKKDGFEVIGDKAKDSKKTEKSSKDENTKDDNTKNSGKSVSFVDLIKNAQKNNQGAPTENPFLQIINKNKK